MVFHGTWLLLIGLQIAPVADDEVVCTPWFPHWRPEIEIEVAPSLLEDVRQQSDRYLNLLLSDDYAQTIMYWDPELDDGAHAVRKPFSNRITGSLEDAVLKTEFRRGFGMLRVNALSDYFVVTVYGIKTESFDALHSMVWRYSEAGWSLFTWSIAYTCGPDQAPLRLTSTIASR